MTLYPLIFQPIFQERIWGGSNIRNLFTKDAPTGAPIGESWEISDRPGAESVIANGPLAGQTLTQLMRDRRDELLGDARANASGRFPLLVKIIDASEKLSLQVHPPAALAPRFGGEPKTEMWYIVDAKPGASLFAGLRKGITREHFAERVRVGGVADCFHCVPVKRGDAMFLPSGRVHAIGGGIVIFEIQQNSDTTYRVYDWDRLDAFGKPRDLHVAQSLECIDFDDFEPSLVAPNAVQNGAAISKALVRDPLFDVDLVELTAGAFWQPPGGSAQVVGLESGEVEVMWSDGSVTLKPGGFCVIPAAANNVVLRAPSAARFLFAKPH